MSRLLTWLIYRGREPGLWGERIWLIMIGCAVVAACVILGLLLTGAWSLPKLPFTIVGHVDWGGHDGDAGGRPQSGRSAAPTAASSVAADPAAADPAGGGLRTWESAAGDLSFDYPANYGAPIREKVEGNVTWSLSDGDTFLFFGSRPPDFGDRTPPEQDYWYWMALGAGQGEDLASKRGSAAASAGQPRYFFVDRSSGAGLGVDVFDTLDGRRIVSSFAEFCSELGMFWITGIGPRADRDRLAADLHLIHGTLFYDKKVTSAPGVWPREFDTQHIVLMTPTDWGTVSSSDADDPNVSEDRLTAVIACKWTRNVRPLGWLQVVPQQGAGILTMSQARAGRETWYAQAEKLVEKDLNGDWDWAERKLIPHPGLVGAQYSATFATTRDGRPWRGLASWIFAGDRRVMVVYACPGSAFEWEHCIFEASVNSLEITG